ESGGVSAQPARRLAMAMISLSRTPALSDLESVRAGQSRRRAPRRGRVCPNLQGGGRSVAPSPPPSTASGDLVCRALPGGLAGRAPLLPGEYSSLATRAGCPLPFRRATSEAPQG